MLRERIVDRRSSRGGRVVIGQRTGRNQHEDQRGLLRAQFHRVERRWGLAVQESADLVFFGLIVEAVNNSKGWRMNAKRDCGPSVVQGFLDVAHPSESDLAQVIGCVELIAQTRQ